MGGWTVNPVKEVWRYCTYRTSIEREREREKAFAAVRHGLVVDKALPGWRKAKLKVKVKVKITRA